LSKFDDSYQQVLKNDPDRLAVGFRDHRISYGQLADILKALSLKFDNLVGKRIVLLLPDGLPSYLWHLHLFLMGAVNVPISIQSSTSKIRELCEKVKPHFIVTNIPLRQRHKSAVESYPCIAVKTDDPNVPWGFDYKVFGAGNDFNYPSSVLDPKNNDVRMIVFTSGSTGEPKGVCLSETNLLAAAEMMVSFLSLDPLRKSLVTVPLYDYYGFIQIYGHLLGQCGYIFGESIGFPDRILKTVLKENVTDLVLVPFTLRELLRIISIKNSDVIQHLNFITSSSDLLTPDLLTNVFKLNPVLRIFNIYGLTEAGRACYREIRQSSIFNGSIGKPSDGVEIIIDSSGGEPGETVIRGPNVMLGYLHEILDERVVFKPCTEMHTGDLAYYDAEGEIILLGRSDHMINIRGSKMHPMEIEALALEVPGVVESHAHKITDSLGEASISLDIVPVNNDCNLDAIRAHMRRNLPPLFYPRQINIVKGIRRTELGSKIIRS
jgi:long-chain acyl-CoA synthetase